MKSIKLLLVSFTLTFVTLINITPALATPSVEKQYLNVNHVLSHPYNNYNIINLVEKKSSTRTSQYSNNFSTGLILSNPAIVTKENSQLTMNVVSKSNEFFNSAMVFSDKLNQFISYFTAPVKGNTAEQLESTSASKVIKAKCKSRENYSL